VCAYLGKPGLPLNKKTRQTWKSWQLYVNRHHVETS
jgi:hypothetical protein